MAGKTMFKRSRDRIVEILADKDGLGKSVTLCGWVQTKRASGDALVFLEVNDGSTNLNLQVVLKNEAEGDKEGKFTEVIKKLTAGVSVQVKGKLVEPNRPGQPLDVNAEDVSIFGEVDAKAYPMPKKKLSLEYIRQHLHLRIRTKTIRAVMAVRNQCCFATHEFFQKHGFKYVHTPLITGTDCEGAGEMFLVTNLMKPEDKLSKIPRPEGEGKEDEVDWSKDFFGKPASLTVSGQLNVEAYACAMSDVYTFGPTFRAEHSNTSRHLAEFWMVEPEMCFATLEDDMDLATDYVKFCVTSVLEKCATDIKILEDFEQREFKQAQKMGQKKGETAPEALSTRLQGLVDKEYTRLSYTKAIELLEAEIKQGKCIVRDKNMKNKDFRKKARGKHIFEFPVFWGVDLASEHEKYLCDKVYNGPVILFNYPKDIKSFYMKLNDDNKTVQAMDMLVPGIGELIGGSAREENYDKLKKRCEEMKMDMAPLEWYMDLRKFGTVPHAGFGLGLERLVMLCTGMTNIKDVIPFPRSYGVCEY